jgi:hypothetical protein
MTPKLWIFSLWFLATAISGIASWGIMSLLAGLTWGLALLGIMTLTGASVGVAQGLVLRLYTADTRRRWPIAKWIILSTLGATVGWFGIIFLRMFTAEINHGLTFDPVYGIIIFFGAAYGLLQWVALGSSNPRNLVWWVFVNAVGWGAGAFLGALVGDAALVTWFPQQKESILIGWPKTFQIFVGGAIAILVYSFLTATGLITMPKDLSKPYE